MPRTLTIQSSAIPNFLGQPTFEPVKLSGCESLNRLFEYELVLKTPDSLNVGASEAADFDLDDFIGREISCTIQLDGSGTFEPGAVGTSSDQFGAGSREINALITEATCVGEEGRHVVYRLTLRPWLYLATLATDCKIYQNKTSIQIIDELLSDYGFPVEKRLFGLDAGEDGHYMVRDFQTQFNETDFEFFSRLMQELGLSYHFEHIDGKHRLIICDAMAAYRSNPSAAYRNVSYHAPNWKPDTEYIHSFVPTNRLTSGRYSTTDYDYTHPRADLSVSRRDPRRTGQADQERYVYQDGTAGAHYAQPNAGSTGPNDPLSEARQLALLGMQAERTHGARAEASGRLRGMVPGHTFKLQNHPRSAANAEYLILATRFTIEDVAQASQIPGAADHRRQDWQVEVDFTAHPVTEPVRPEKTQPKPRSHGPQVALVVGPPGENIWTDEYGRIKVQFVWDRVGQKNQNSSCWVRTTTTAAGADQGAHHSPRTGQEVLIDFENGDPDRPICIGRVHNRFNMPPWMLPSQSALSGIRSRELTPGEGNAPPGKSNHLILDDTYQQIQAQLKSDHLTSQLSLGYITRIEDNAGRKDARGEGFGLETNGHGALRTDKGLLISTDGRSRAVGGILSRDELVACLEKAVAIAKDLAKAADKCEAATRVTKPQQDLSEAVTALGYGANNELTAKGKVQGSQPVLALSGAAGIASATPRDHVQYAGQNIDTVAGHNQQHYADQSILHTAGQDIEQVAARGDIRTIANVGKIIQQAQHDSVEITADKSLTITSTEDEVVVRAKKSITLVIEDGTYLRLADGKVTLGMPGQFLVHSASQQFTGPSTLSVSMPEFNRVDQAQQLKLHNIADKGHKAVQRNFKITKATGEVLIDKSNGAATSKLPDHAPFDLGP